MFDVTEQKPYENHNINCVARYYDTEDFSLILIIVTLNITIYNNIAILPSPSLVILQSPRHSPLSFFDLTNMAKLLPYRSRQGRIQGISKERSNQIIY